MVVVEKGGYVTSEDDRSDLVYKLTFILGLGPLISQPTMLLTSSISPEQLVTTLCGETLMHKKQFDGQPAKQPPR